MSAQPTPPLDVVIVNYFSGDLLTSCIATLQGFVPPGSNFIFVDNSPADGAVARAAAQVPRPTVLPQDSNIGFAAAVNTGIAAGSAAIILLANPDVVSVNGSFATVSDLFARRPRAGALTGRIVDEHGVLMHCRRTPRLADFFELALGFNRLLPRRLRRPSVAMVEWAHDTEREVESVTGAFLFLRRAAIEDVGPFDERFFVYWEETDWLLRARQRGWSTYFLPELEIIHLGESSSPASAGHSTLFVDSLYAYVRKHHGGLKSQLLRTLWTGADALRLARSRLIESGDPIFLRARLESHLRRSSRARR
jgi:N-acetylglucosaminyl-diphospho-decaprenol L-rhamnosyltransferase